MVIVLFGFLFDDGIKKGGMFPETLQRYWFHKRTIRAQVKIFEPRTIKITTI